MNSTRMVEEAGPPAEIVPEYGPHPSPGHCGCGGRISAVEHEIEQLHRLYHTGEICESTYRRVLQQLEAELAVLSRAF